MQPKKILYYISKISFIDELLGFIYWALAIYGIFLIARSCSSGLLLIASLVIYVPVVAVIYLGLLKKIRSYFKDNKR